MSGGGLSTKAQITDATVLAALEPAPQTNSGSSIGTDAYDDGSMRQFKLVTRKNNRPQVHILSVCHSYLKYLLCSIFYLVFLVSKIVRYVNTVRCVRWLCHVGVIWQPRKPSTKNVLLAKSRKLSVSLSVWLCWLFDVVYHWESLLIFITAHFLCW